MLILALGALVLLGLVLWFVSLEIAGRRHGIFVALVVVVLVEAVVAGGGADVPIGILRPSFFGQDFRVPDVIILAAIAARVVVAPWRRIGPLAMVWIPFIVIYATGSLTGFLNDLPPMDVLYQSKTLFYLVGGAVVASGADLRRLANSAGTCALVLAPLVPLALLLRTSGTVVSVDLPLQRLPRLGLLSTDTITMLVGIGAGALLIETVREQPRLRVVIACVVLMLGPMSGAQRASYISLAVAVVVLAFVALGSTWHRRSAVTTSQVALGLAALAAVVLFGFVVTRSPGVLVSSIEDAFGGVGNEQSADARISLQDEALEKISEHPWIGSGVGTRIVASVEKGEVNAAAHNIVLDLALRVGLIGLASFVVAVATTAWFGVRAWRLLVSNGCAAVAMSAVIMIGAVLGKALVEPALDKYRLAAVTGISLGLIAVAYEQLRSSPPDKSLSDERSRESKSSPTVSRALWS